MSFDPPSSIAPVSVTVSGTVAVSNLPATQPVSGTVAVSNLPATQPVSGTVAVSAVSGTVTVDGSGHTQPVSVASLPLPAGAALDTTAQGVESAVGELAFDSWLRFEETRWS